MKISNNTQAILKNFSQINTGMLFKSGNMLSVLSAERNILAEAYIEEIIPQDFGIYDLSNFLSVVSLYKNGAELDFNDKHVIIKGMDGRSKIYYRITDPMMIYDEKNREIIDNKSRPKVNGEISFKLSKNDFEWITKTADVLDSPNISVESDGNYVSLVCFDSENDSVHTQSLTLPDVDTDGRKFKLVFKTDYLKIIPNDYFVEISSNGVSKFHSPEKNITYWISLDTQSTYN